MKTPHIDTAFHNLKETCDKKIASLYPTKVPDMVESRYTQELSYLQNSEYLDEFEIFRLLSKEAKKSSQVIMLRGTLAGSYLIYLLGNSLINPLPAHYICPKCGHFETMDSSLLGIDLPKTNCPNCNEDMNSDGFQMSVESVWGLDGKKNISFEYNISEEFLPFAKRVLENLYPDNSIVPLGVLCKKSGKQVITMNKAGFVVLPTGRTIDDYPDMHGYLENGDLCLTGNALDMQAHNMRRILLIGCDAANHMVIMQRKTGIYIDDISIADLRCITWNDLCNTTALNDTETALYKEFKPKTFTNMTRLSACVHDTFKTAHYNMPDHPMHLLQLLRQDGFDDFPCFTRDDIFETALSFGMEQEDAFTISELVAKGKIGRTPEILDEFDLPDSFKETVKECLYLMPRAHCVSILLTQAILAYYMKKDSRSYSRLIYQKS